jgi:hypothetical protein
MRPSLLATTSLLSLLTCSRASTPAPLEVSTAGATPEAEQPSEAEPAKRARATGIHYCDVYPERCRPCPGEPGSCGGEPVAGACCCGGNGCEGVELASSCDTGCDFYYCEWGYQSEDAAGIPEFTCYD